MLLNDARFIKKALLKAAKVAKATVIDSAFNLFNPYGVSGFVVIAESHLSIHTWPELGYAAIDVFTCGNTALPEKATEYLVHAFECQGFFLYKVNRGIMNKETQVTKPYQLEVIQDEFNTPQRLAL